MGRQPLSAETAVKFIEWQRAYAAHPDPPTAAINLIAIIIAWNGPFYPLYVIALLGKAGFVSLVTIAASPVFFAVPWLARRNDTVGRFALPSIGVVNTIWCTKLFGVNSGIPLFFLPCIVLAAFLFRARERVVGLCLIGCAMAPILVPQKFYGAALLPLSLDDTAQLARLNLVSVTMLFGLLALQLRNLIGPVEKGTRVAPEP
jgi:hypothetical protein